MRVGWLSTGRDQAACNLLSDVVARAQQDDVPLDIGAVFCDRERGEAPESDRFLDLVDRLGIPAVTLSSRASWAEAQKLGVSRADWRDEYHRGVAELLIPYRLGVLVLAGYMLIASPALCRRFAMLNLHPALPGGPKGMWQQVIWELLESGADETGAMIHLATAQLDRGPVRQLLPLPAARPRLGPAVEAVPRQAQDDERGRRSPRPRARTSRCSPRSAGAARSARSRCSTTPSASSPRASSTPPTAACSPSRRGCRSTSRRRSTQRYRR